MGVAEEDAGNRGRRETADNGVEEGGWIGETIAAIVAGEDVADDPSALVVLLAVFELGDEEFEDAGLVGVSEIEEVEDVAGVPLYSY